MRAICIFGLALVLCGCAVSNALQKASTAYRVMGEQCNRQYAQWTVAAVKADASQNRAAHALISCIHEHGVSGPVTLDVATVYGATPPPNGIPNVQDQVVRFSAIRYQSHNP